MDRDCFSLDEFAERNGIGLTTAYLEIKAGRLQARKVGRRTLIAVEDARAWRERLPKLAVAESAA
jgi:excisionase family DNA binding protein